MKVVYIASPYTIGDTARNVSVHIQAAAKLIKRGYCPIAPLLSHFVQIYQEFQYEKWMEIDMELLSRSDAILRIPGESPGAEREVQKAVELDIPVFYSVEELDVYFGS